MKKLLLSSAVMFFLCTVSFAQQQKQLGSPKQHQGTTITAAQQAELEQKKVREYEAQQKNMTPEKQLEMEAKKMQAQKLEKEKKINSAKFSKNTKMEMAPAKFD